MAKHVLFISTECYPAAKAGGMADVVGALPRYLPQQGWKASVIIPYYDLPWFQVNNFESIFTSSLNMEFQEYRYTIWKYVGDELPYDFYCLDIPDLYYRDSIYLASDGKGYWDEIQRNVGLQRATLQWIRDVEMDVDVMHCHDHQTGFIPFMLKHCPEFATLSRIPTCYTIHNGAYNTCFGWNRRYLLPDFPPHMGGSIDWNNMIDSSATAVRWADHVNAVSPTNLEELRGDLPALRFARDADPDRFSGILNGIDDQMWNPATDKFLSYQFDDSWDTFKRENKQALLGEKYTSYGVLFGFIGRFAYQKGADLLLPAIESLVAKHDNIQFFILGSGDKGIESEVEEIVEKYPDQVFSFIGYNEGIAHQLYAASDFLMMPSRFEPCGLNQMFAMRYGSVPIAHMTGGLKDTVVDYTVGGAGISFDRDTVEDLQEAITRAYYLFGDKKRFEEIRTLGVKSDFSWDASAKIYSEQYNKLITSK